MTTGDKDFSVEDAMAVDSTPDEVRTHGDPDETEVANVNGGSLEQVEDGKLKHETDAPGVEEVPSDGIPEQGDDPDLNQGFQSDLEE